MLRLLALVVLTLLPLAPVAAAPARQPTPAATSAAPDPFYLPPAPLPAGEPGALIRSEAMPASESVRAWRILYRSTAADGSDIAVSGALFVPDREPPPGGFPLVAVGHNTTGAARVCAPSLDPFRPLPGADAAFYPQQVAGWVEGGFAAVATDYQGLGVPAGVHPYLVGAAAAHDVLNAARAARAVPGVALAPETILWGHSQGGHAAAWAGQLAPRYAPDLDIAGVVLAAPVADPRQVLAAATGGGANAEPTPLTGYVASLAYAWARVYPELAAAPALTPAGLAKADVIAEQCIPTVVAAYGDRPLADYVDAAAFGREPWASLLERNAAGRARIAAPLLVVQGGADPLVPAAATEALVSRMCDLGSTASLALYPEAGHGSVIAPAMPDVLVWATDRLRGAPPSSRG